MQSIVTCPLCGADSQKARQIFQSSSFKIVQCAGCTLGYLAEWPEDISGIYSESYFTDKQMPEYIMDARKKFEYVKKHITPSTRILDYGCGLGDFIGICKENNHNIVGYDIAESVGSYVHKKYGVSVKTGRLEANMYEPSSFDLITCFDVIEHIPDFIETLSYLFSWLAPGGRLILTTPNLESWDRKVFGKYWYGFTKLPQHILYFSPRTIQRALQKAGFPEAFTQQWGFVRSLGFPLKVSFPPYIFFPMIDMIVVAQK